jgi:hypothetical protein
MVVGTNNYAPEHFKSRHDIRIAPSGSGLLPTSPFSPPPPTNPPTTAPTTEEPVPCLGNWEICSSAPGTCCSGNFPGNQRSPNFWMPKSALFILDAQVRLFLLSPIPLASSVLLFCCAAPVRTC